jgi:hypothetical protein
MGTKMHHGSKKRLLLGAAAAVPAAALMGTQAHAAPVVTIINLGPAGTNAGPGTTTVGWTAFRIVATADTGDVIGGDDFSSTNLVVGANTVAAGVFGTLLQRWTGSTSGSATPINPIGNNSQAATSADSHLVTNAGQAVAVGAPGNEDSNVTKPTGVIQGAGDSGTYGAGTFLHGAIGFTSPQLQTQTLAYVVLKDGVTGTANLGVAQAASSGGPATGFAFSLTFGAVTTTSTPNKIISLTAVAPTSYGNKLTQSATPGADQATFNPNASDSIIHVTGSGATGYVKGSADNIGGTANGENKFNVEATGWNPNTDQEIYALNIKVNGSDPSAAQISAIIADINGANGNTGNITASTVSGQFAAVFPGYDILLTAANGTISPEFLGVDFSADSTTTGVTVTNVAAVPEPVSAAGLLLGAAGLLLGRRKRNA